MSLLINSNNKQDLNLLNGYEMSIPLHSATRNILLVDNGQNHFNKNVAGVTLNKKSQILCRNLRSSDTTKGVSSYRQQDGGHGSRRHVN